MTRRLSTLERKQLDQKRKEQELLGYPDFKTQIVNDMVNMYDVRLEEALQSVLHTDINKFIMKDIAWAQHMGTEYWAELAYEKHFLKKVVV